MLHGNVVQAEQMAIAGGLNVGKKVRHLANRLLILTGQLGLGGMGAVEEWKVTVLYF